MLVSNVNLTQINASSGSDDYDADMPTTPKWTGDEQAYLYARTYRQNTPSGSEYVRDWRVYIERGTPPVVIDVGDVLLLTRRLADLTTVTYELPVLSVNDREQDGMPNDVQTLEIIVEPTAPGSVRV